MNTEVPAAWLAAFPGTRFLSEWRLMIWVSRGVIDASRVESMLRWLEMVEPRLGSFNRFVDLSEVTEIRLRTEEILAITQRRRERYTGEPVLSVFLAGTALTYGIARMYERLMIGSQIQVHVMAQLTSTATMLAVPADVLMQNIVRLGNAAPHSDES